jgi:ankyrin repeat protein
LDHLFQSKTNSISPPLSGFTALHAAIVFGHISIVGKLLDAGANIDAKADNAITALDFAYAMGRPAIVELLLSKKLNDLKSEEGSQKRTAINALRATINGLCEKVHVTYDQKKMDEIKNEFDNFMLLNGRIEKFLEEGKSKKDEKIVEVCSHAYMVYSQAKNAAERANVFVRLEQSIKTEREQAIQTQLEQIHQQLTACRNQSEFREIKDNLSDFNINEIFDYTGKTVLSIVMEYNDVPLMRLLLEQGVQPTKRDCLTEHSLNLDWIRDEKKKNSIIISAPYQLLYLHYHLTKESDAKIQEPIRDLIYVIIELDRIQRNAKSCNSAQEAKLSGSQDAKSHPSQQETRLSDYIQNSRSLTNQYIREIDDLSIVLCNLLVSKDKNNPTKLKLFCETAKITIERLQNLEKYREQVFFGAGIYSVRIKELIDPLIQKYSQIDTPSWCITVKPD